VMVGCVPRAGGLGVFFKKNFWPGGTGGGGGGRGTAGND